MINVKPLVAKTKEVALFSPCHLSLVSEKYCFPLTYSRKQTEHEHEHETGKAQLGRLSKQIVCSARP